MPDALAPTNIREAAEQLAASAVALLNDLRPWETLERHTRESCLEVTFSLARLAGRLDGTEADDARP